VDAARSDMPTPRSRARTCAAQWREQEWAARKKERRIRRRERREQRDEEYLLREQQGLSPLAASQYSSEEEEEEESDGGGGLPPRGGILRPPSPRAAEAVEEQALGTGAEAPAAGRSAEGMARATEAPARAAEVSGSAAVATTAPTIAPAALEEEEVGLLHLEVSSRSSRRSDFEGLEPNFISPCSQGGANRPRPHTRQGAEVGHVHAHEAALIEGVAGSRERSGGE
jgi:hypothetical protein